MADPYNPVQQVAPQVASPDNLLSVHASPTDFGSQVGQATQKLGATAEQASSQQTDVLIQRQEQLNSVAVANGETDLNSQYGDIEGKYKALRGMAAVNGREEAVKQIQQVRQNVLKSLPNDAVRRAFNLTAARTEGFVLRDFGNHAATELKSADNQSTKALEEQTIENASKWSVASDDREIGFTLGTIGTTAAKLTQNQGWDLSTPEGKQVYNQYLDQQRGRIWENVIKTIADDPEKGDPVAAVKKLEENRDAIPAATYAKLSQALTPQYRAVQARTGASVVIKGIDDDYTKSVTSDTPLPEINKNQPSSPWQGTFINKDDSGELNKLTDKFIQQESGGRGNNLGQVQPGTWKQFAKPGEDVSDPIDNRNVTQRVLTKYAHDYHGDLGKIAVAYFSGPGNVSDGPTPWKQDFKDSSGKSTSSYVSDITKGSGSQTAQVTPNLPGQTNVPVFRAKAEYYEMNQEKIDQKARDWAQANFPNDIRMQDDVVARSQQYYRGIIQAENGKKAADTELVRRTVFGEGNNGQLITNISQLENGSPEIRDAWQRMQLNNPLGAEALKTKVLAANSRGKQLEYGTDFWKHYEDVVTGKVTNISELYHYVGSTKNDPLTNTGIAQLQKELQYAQTPEGSAFLHAEKQFFDSARKQITNSATGPGFRDAKGDALFNKFMIQTLPKIMAGRAAGKGPGELFDEEGSDYVGSSLGSFQRSPAELKRDMLTGHMTPQQFNIGAPTKPVGVDYKKLDGIQDKEAAKANIQAVIKANPGMSLEDKKKLFDYTVKRGWVHVQPQVPNAQ